MSSEKDPTPTIVDQQRALLDRWPFDDTQDLADARRGLIATLEPGVVHAHDGRVVWDNDSYAFLTGDAPDSVNPSLWRQSRLVALQGLFEVTEGVYQVRGLDLSNITFIEGDAGVVVVDPLISTETAAAALALYRAHRGERPVTGVIYTHSHVDHFGGVKGVTTQEDVDAGRVLVLAPEGLVEHAVAENIYAGVAMSRRAGYMYGAALARGPRGQVGAGLGQTTSTGTVTLIRPTVDVTVTGQVEVVDGLRIEFQMAPGTEAPAELHFYVPRYRALCMAENATHNLHNLLTLRGALVRDPNAWAKYLTEAIGLFAERADVAFASHHWPTWGTARIVEYLSTQRDLYAYLHDQTLRMLNEGLTGPEIAERMALPPALEHAWHTHGYYGSVSHNVKAIYQRYLGWFDGNPSHLWQHPPVEQAKRYVAYMGGADAVVSRSRASFADGDYRWVAEVLGHVVFAEPGHAAARELLADTYEQLGYGAENGTWRNFYLSGATELRSGPFGTPVSTSAADLLDQLTPEMLFDALAVQVNGPRAWDEDLTIDVVLGDAGSRYRVRLARGVLTHRRVDVTTGADSTRGPDATVTVPHHQQLAMLAGGDAEAMAAAGIVLTGDASAIARLVAVLEPGDPDFAIVTE